MNRIAALIAIALIGLASRSSADENRMSVRSDVRVGAGDAVDNAASLFGSVIVDGEVRHTAVSLMGDVTIGATGRVGGDAISVGGAVYRVEGSSVAGRTTSIGMPGAGLGTLFVAGLPIALGAAAILGAIAVVASSAGFVVLVVLILVLFERRVAAARAAMMTAPGRAVLWGLAGSLALIPLAILLSITVIGIPLAILVVLAALAAICLGSVAACEWLGRELSRAFRWNLSPVWTGLLGLSALFLLGFVPVIGVLVHAAVVVAGLGAVILTRFGAAPPDASA